MKKAYDKAKAHEYYLKHRKLKGRKHKPKTTGAKLSQRTSKRTVKATAPKNVSLQFGNKGGKGVKVDQAELERIGAKLADIKKRVANLSPEKKAAVKSTLVSIRSKIKRGK